MCVCALGLLQCRFDAAVQHLSTVNEKQISYLLLYLRFKSAFYAAYSMTYTGMHVFATDEKCGVALKCYAQAQVWGRGTVFAGESG